MSDENRFRIAVLASSLVSYVVILIAGKNLGFEAAFPGFGMICALGAFGPAVARFFKQSPYIFVVIFGVILAQVTVGGIKAGRTSLSLEGLFLLTGIVLGSYLIVTQGLAKLAVDLTSPANKASLHQTDLHDTNLREQVEAVLKRSFGAWVGGELPRFTPLFVEEGRAFTEDYYRRSIGRSPALSHVLHDSDFDDDEVLVQAVDHEYIHGWVLTNKRLYWFNLGERPEVRRIPLDDIKTCSSSKQLWSLTLSIQTHSGSVGSLKHLADDTLFQHLDYYLNHAERTDSGHPA